MKSAVAYLKKNWLSMIILSLLVFVIGFYTAANFENLQARFGLDPDGAPDRATEEDFRNGTVDGESGDDKNDNRDGLGVSTAPGLDPFCGDGNTDTQLGEECDDGNTNDNDSCSNSCEIVTQEDRDKAKVVSVLTGETTNDDGLIEVDPNANTGNGHVLINPNSPTIGRCGDGIENNIEQCDDGNTSNNDLCVQSCKDAQCGDGFLQYLDADGDVLRVDYCDDGNTVSGDGCSSTCRSEFTPECGNGVLETYSVPTGSGLEGVNGTGMYAEECDDGNTNDNDSCSNSCEIRTPVVIPSEYCGNGVLENGEECDDGNTNDNDSCDNECKDNTPTLPMGCGNDVRESGEECDDGNTDNGDGCSILCEIEYCGDNVRQAGLGEECDDGNSNPDDSCDNSCNRNRTVASFCGDWTTNHDDGEECDDGNTDNGDGCDSQCQYEGGGPSVHSCGNGVEEYPYEECDDGNRSNGDGCDRSCRIEDFDFDPFPQDRCGNNLVDIYEECDDGNRISGDGCNAICLLEDFDDDDDLCIQEFSYRINNPRECGICDDRSFQADYENIYLDECPGASVNTPQQPAVTHPSPDQPQIVITTSDGTELRGTAIIETGPRENILIALMLSLFVSIGLSYRHRLNR